MLEKIKNKTKISMSDRFYPFLRYTSQSETLNGWLINFINLFGNSNGFDKYKRKSGHTITIIFYQVLSVSVSVALHLNTHTREEKACFS